MLERNPHATPVVDALTYYVDLMNWLLRGQARSSKSMRADRRAC